MSASPLPPEAIERRRHIRRVAAHAHENGWAWIDGANGWRLPNGDFLDVERLFRSTHPQDFLLETSWRAVSEPAAIEAIYHEVPALPAEGETR